MGLSEATQGGVIVAGKEVVGPGLIAVGINRRRSYPG